MPPSIDPRPCVGRAPAPAALPQPARTSIDALPDELLLQIFAGLGPQALRAAAQVNRSWSRAACDPSLGLWRGRVLAQARACFAQAGPAQRGRKLQALLERAVCNVPPTYLLRDSQLLFANAPFFEQRDRPFARALFSGVQRVLVARSIDYRKLTALDAEVGVRKSVARACNNIALIRMRWTRPAVWSHLEEVSAFAAALNVDHAGEFFGHQLFARLRTCEVPARDSLWTVKAEPTWLTCHAALQASASWRQLSAQLTCSALALLGHENTSVRQSQGTQACLRLLAERLNPAQVARMADAEAPEASVMAQDLRRLGQQALALALV